MESVRQSFNSAISAASATLSSALSGDPRALAAVGAAAVLAVGARRLLSSPRQQPNGGRGGDVALVSPTGKACVVTGCDTGFGYLTAVELARLGFTVFAALFNPGASLPKLEAELDALRADRNKRNITGVVFEGNSGSPLGKIIGLPLDVTKDESVKAFYDAVVSHPEFAACSGSPGLYALINNAGINAGYLIEMSTIEHLQRNMDVNYLGAFRVLKAFMPNLRRYALDHAKDPAIAKPRMVNITSGAGIMVTSPLGAYSASKHALEAVVDALRQELMHHQIPLHLNLIEPTIAMTPIVTADLSSQFDHYMDEAGVSDEVMEAYGGREYQRAQWCLSAVHISAKKEIGAVEPEVIVKGIVEEAARASGMRYRRPVPAFMGRILWMYQNLPEGMMDALLVAGQKRSIGEKLAEMEAQKASAVRMPETAEKVLVPA
ncbi:hypothetical protein DFJ74DRAFT_684939 [Hyaloraphidium curvatum]|nr:hypothetical protein DFJ74DRAFT_684939 [Hyaloraphidium curvatum]